MLCGVIVTLSYVSTTDDGYLYAVNDDGRIDFEEFCHLLSGRAKDLDEEEKELMEAFRVFDRNHNGTLNKAELREVSLPAPQCNMIQCTI